ncbi:MAG: glycosyl hydrolase 115 family protein [Verrucomicrobiae bacterium]|nr:glycosyl hydrolase 115 family protein [Verrucomicrobiae bacterium]
MKKRLVYLLHWSWRCAMIACFVLMAARAVAFELVGADRIATVCVPASEPECARLAAADLIGDVRNITGQTLRLSERDGDVVLASLNLPDSAALLEKIAPEFGHGLKGKWESYRVETVGERLIIAGSDERGTMFGLYAFIEKHLGVDPFYYWASRPLPKRSTLAWDRIELGAAEPTFKFRGWFINDEDLLTEFRLDSGKRRIDYPFYHRVISPHVSARIYEAALRLGFNTIIPSSFVDIRNPAEARLVEDAVRRGLFVTIHHVEPLGVSAFGFDNYWKGRGMTVPFQFTRHADKFYEIWRNYATRWARFGPHVIWQLGLRGIADQPVWRADPNVPESDEGRGKLISDAMAKQWEIIRNVDKRPQPLATTTLWSEGAALHAGGHLKFPEGVAVIFSDNSPGWQWQRDFYNVKREAGRPYGIYYHQQLWGSGPHLVQGVSPYRTHAVLREAVQRGDTYYAMLNVGNVRKFVLGLAASSQMLRDFKAFDPRKFMAEWCEDRFGSEAKAVESVYCKHFSSFVADPKTGQRAMLDGEWKRTGLRLATNLLVQLETGVKSSRKPKGILSRLRPQLEIQYQVASEISNLLPRLTGENREFFESNLVAQHKIMLGLLRFAEAVAEADLAFDAGELEELKRHTQGTAEAIALIESGKALASRGEFRDWYRGDRKMNCAELNELSAKLQAASQKLKPRKSTLDEFPCIGKLTTRHARDIKSSTWSVGGETLDRDFAVYANYKQYLGPLGAKRIRFQAGWAKCEKQRGIYDWAWLDECINDALAQGVQPWVQTSYGNPIYPDGGGTGLGAGLPKSSEALAAWDNWVRALVRRYKDRVQEWEIWNEPDLGQGITAEAFAEFHLRTAAVIRAEQPKARIYALALANPGKTEFAETLLKLAKERGQLHLIDAITIHGYPANPDDTRPVDRFRKLVSRYSSNIEIRQGETGAPSGETVGALRHLPWTEVKQAKWNLRRMLAHHAKDVPFNLFTLCDLKYAQPKMTGFNRKGLLLCNEDKTVARPKLAYHAAQRVFSIFDESLERIRDFQFASTTTQSLAVVAYRKKVSGLPVVAIWLNGAPPTDSSSKTEIEIAFPSLHFKQAVYADLLTGNVCALPASFKKIPLYDSPVLIAEKAALPIQTLD